MYDDYETTGDLMEAHWLDGLEADMEQAALEAEGNRYARNLRKVEQLIAEGDLDAATELCMHGHVGLLKGACSEGDPRYGEEGYRCFECGAVVTDIHGDRMEVR